MKTFSLKFLILIVLCCSALSGYTQAEKLDSLKMRLKNEKPRQQIETYLDISELPVSRDTVLYYLDKAMKTAREIHFDSVYPIQFAISAAYYLKGDFKRAKTEIRKGFNNYKFTTDPQKTLGHINMLLGAFNEAMNEIDSAKYYYDIAIKQLKKSDSRVAKSTLAATYTNLGNLYLKKGDYEKAVEIYLLAEKLLEENKEKTAQLVNLNNIAGCFKEMGQYDKALKYYEDALGLARETDNLQYAGAINLGIGQVYMKRNNIDRAIEYFEEGIKWLEKTGFKKLLGEAYQNLAEAYLNKGDYEKAQKYSDKALSNVNEIGDDFTKVSILITSSALSRKRKRYRRALQKINEGLAIARKNNYLHLEEKCLKEKITLLKLLNKKDSLPELYERYIVLRDSIFNDERQKAMNELETKYQAEKKEKENQRLLAEKYKQEALIQQKNKQNFLLAGGLGMAVTVAGLFGFFYTRNRRQKRLIEGLQKDLHHRVKNNLGVISSLVDEIKNQFREPELQARLNDLHARIMSIHKIHEQLYKEKNVYELRLKDYLEKLAESVQKTYGRDDVEVNIRMDEKIKLNPLKTFPLGLIVAEFLSNSFKHAFKDKAYPGRIDMVVEQSGDKYVLKLNDNGPGPEKEIDFDRSDSYGIRIMKGMAKQMGARLKLYHDKGMHMELAFG